MEPRNINLTPELIKAAKADYQESYVNLSQRARELLTKYYKKKGFM